MHVDGIDFDFEKSVLASKFDSSTHYLDVCRMAHKKAVDIVAVDVQTIPLTYLVEVKDFRVITSPPGEKNVAKLPETVAAKVTDTLACLADASTSASIPTERHHAKVAVSAPKCRIVLHLEPHVGAKSALFPLGFPASVLFKLRTLVSSIDPHPLVLSIATTPASGVPWSAS